MVLCHAAPTLLLQGLKKLFSTGDTLWRSSCACLPCLLPACCAAGRCRNAASLHPYLGPKRGPVAARRVARSIRAPVNEKVYTERNSSERTC